jgi:hypothetical protein
LTLSSSLLGTLAIIVAPAVAPPRADLLAASQKTAGKTYPIELSNMAFV